MSTINQNHPAIKKKKNFFRSSLPKKNILLSLIISLHLLGIIVAFFRTDIPFHYHLLRFFSWWSVHTSIFTVLATVVIFRERKKISSYFTQFITFLATMYNLITFVFWVYCLFFLSVGWEKSTLLNCQSFSWHFIAPFLTLFYFYFYAQIDKLRKKIIKTLLFSFIAPVFYFFYVWILAKLNVGETSSLFPHLEKYPYFIFEWIAERKWKWFIINFLIAFFTFISLCSLIIWTKLVYDKKVKKLV